MAHDRGWLLLTLGFLGAGKTVGIIPCSTAAQAFVVEDTAGALALKNALNCTGGVFDVQWEGTVVVEETMAVMSGSVLSITGVGSDDAIASGNGATQLFTVTDASLDITGLQLVDGRASSGGGAIASYTSTVTLSDTDFRRNEGRAGGALSVSDSIVTLSGDTAFEENSASSDGGAVHVMGESSVLSWGGITTFSGNVAYDYGGAFHVVDYAVVSWSGQTSFANNSATFAGGGAISAQYFTEVSWSGTTAFVENSAVNYGGAVFSQRCRVAWEGETVFLDNSAGIDGGAVAAFDCDISWRGQTVFRNNSCPSNGGALTVAADSNVSWSGTSSFVENRSSQGGALAVDSSSNVSWAGETSFAVNTASISGGALWVGGSSSVYSGGDTTFVGNYAVQSGGAVEDSALGSSTMLFVEGATAFVTNEAGINGGAITLDGGLSLDFSGVDADVSFTGNSAGYAGGAVYFSGVAQGHNWTNVNFVSNSALVGGAVYSLASGTEIDEDGTEFPNVYNGSLFANNSAVTGGAVESAVGKDVFFNTRFEGNTADGVGGALRMAGTTVVTFCDFEGNGAGGGGPAVSNVGVIVIQNTSFERNTLLCTSGTFLDYAIKEYTTEDAQQVSHDSMCDGCEPCQDCVVDGFGTQECVPEYEHTSSAGVDGAGNSVVLQGLEIDSGYWRATNTSTSILPCWNEDACAGGLTDAADYCDSGYTGPYCSICEEGYTATQAYTCSKCGDGKEFIGAVIVLIVAAASLALVAAYLISKTDGNKPNGPGGASKEGFRRLVKALPMQALKTVVVSWQILTQFDSVANVTYPGVYGRFLDGVSAIVNLDVGLVLSAGCIMETDFHDRLLVSTLGPVIALGLLGATYRVALRRNRHSHDALQSVQRKHCSMALLITFLVYSSASSTLFRMFACEKLDDGRDYLRADYTIECDSPKHEALEAYAVLMIILYPVGIPVIYGAILFLDGDILRDEHRRSVPSADVQVTADLWKPYRPERFYYEVVECARRVTLTGVVVFIYPNTAGQVAVTLVLAFAFVIVSESLAPYASSQDAWLSRVGHIVVFLSMFQALLLKVDVSDERSDSQEVFGVVLLAANVCMVVAFIAEAVMVTSSFLRREDSDKLEETDAPRFRSTLSATRVIEDWEAGDESYGRNSTAQRTSMAS